MCTHWCIRTLTREIDRHTWSTNYVPGLVLGSAGGGGGAGVMSAIEKNEILSTLKDVQLGGEEINASYITELNSATDAATVASDLRASSLRWILYI